MARHFPDLLEAYLQWVQNHEGSKLIHKWSMLSVMGAALERRVWISRGFYNLYPNLYVFIVGRSGVVKKSSTTNIAVKLLRELPNIHIMSERLTASALIDQISMSKKVFEHEDIQKIQTPIFCYAPELIVFIKEVFGSITELLTTFYDSPDVWSYKTRHQGEIIMKGVCLSILGATTKEWLERGISETEMNAGFAGRVIFVVENNAPERWIAWPKPPENSDYIRQCLVEDLADIYEMTGEFKIDKEAYDEFERWYCDYMTKHEADRSTLGARMGGYKSRKGEMALRIAMIKSASEGRSFLITKRHFDWAMQELDALDPAMKSIYQDSYMTATQKLANSQYTPQAIQSDRRRSRFESILDFIKRKGAVSRLELNERFKLLEAREIKTTIDSMVKAEVLQQVDRNGIIMYEPKPEN